MAQGMAEVANEPLGRHVHAGHWGKALSIAALALLASPATADPADFPRTATGKPDFSGRYDVGTLTPYTRPARHGDALNLDAAEAAKAEANAAARMAAAYAAADPDRGPPEKGANVDARSYDYFWFDPGSTMFQIDGEYRTSIIVDPPNGRLPAVSEAGKARRAGLRPEWWGRDDGTAWWLPTGQDPYDNPEGMTLRDRCLYLGHVTVPALPVVYNNLKVIVQTEHHVLILIEWMHWARIVRLGAEHVPEDIRSLGGDSVGWWEDDTLVVETTNFLSSPGVPREGLRVIERFSPLDANRLLYRFTVHDPDYVAPYTGEMPWPKTESHLYEYACHEGNYSMANTLRGARRLEKVWIETHGEPPAPDGD